MMALICTLETGQAWAQQGVQQGAQSQGEKLTVERMEENGQKFYEVHAGFFVPATPQTVWKVLTDYDRFPQFVPTMPASKVIARNGPEVTVEQDVRGTMFFFSRKIHLVVRVLEQPYTRIDIGLVSGDMKRYEAHWELIQETQDGIGGTRIDYRGRMEPDFFLPSLFGRSLIKSDGEKMLDAVVAEIGKNNRPEPPPTAPIAP